MKKRIAIAFSVCVLVGGTSLLAHHSQASFDLSKQVTVEGVVTQVNWANPHSLFFMEVKGEGDVKKWALEGPGPNGLTSKGWTAKTLNIGDKITATGNPSRSGRPMMLLKEVVTAEGKRLETGVTGNFDPSRRTPAYPQ
jgi:hypothetical protein